MPVRTTNAAVLLLLDSAPTDTELTAYVADAALWVDEHLVGACDGLTTGTLEAVERYVAAHLSTLKYPVRKRIKISDTDETFSATGDDTTTQYLRAAAALDPCGVVQDLLVDSDRPRGKARVGAGYVTSGGGT